MVAQIIKTTWLEDLTTRILTVVLLAPKNELGYEYVLFKKGARENLFYRKSYDQ